VNPWIGKFNIKAGMIILFLTFTFPIIMGEDNEIFSFIFFSINSPHHSCPKPISIWTAFFFAG